MNFIKIYDNGEVIVCLFVCEQRYVCLSLCLTMSASSQFWTNSDNAESSKIENVSANAIRATEYVLENATLRELCD